MASAPEFNYINGSQDDDTLTGTAGNDYILMYGGRDEVSGLAGDDLIWLSATLDETGEILDGGEGSDTLILSSNNGGGNYVTGSFDLRDDTITDVEILAFTNTGANRMQISILAGQMLFDEILNYGDQQNAVLDVFMEDQTSLDLSNMIFGSWWTGSSGPSELRLFGDDDGETIVTANVATLIDGGGGADNLRGGTADDTILGGEGADWITPGGGSDTVDGGDGRDMISFYNLADTPGRTNVDYRLDIDMQAGTAVNHDGSEQIAFSNVERITTTIYADRIRGTDGDDEIRALGNYDWIIATEGNDTIDGGSGQDMISFLEYQSSEVTVVADVFSANGLPPSGALATGVVIDLANSANNTALAEGLTLTSVERITGSSRQDVFYGDDGENDFRGLGGYDWFVSSTGGRERYYGGSGTDTVTYYNASSGVTANLSNGAVTNGRETGYGSVGDARSDLYVEIENLVGSRFDDELRGSSERNQLSGLEGDDFLFGYGGVDYLMGGLGNDVIDGGGGSDYALFTGNAADYTLTRSGNNVTVVGADGTDQLIDVEYFRFDDGDVTIWDL
ncbi:hypothetical protein N4R57_19990 [Rhodobacteraceae bacterium D3-12]|nr:hypothetical protein N4R57_19990 [Rhodobacteraceae bacterium D3-12]